MGQGRDDAVDPRLGRHIVSKGEKDENDRRNIGMETKQGQIVWVFQLNNASSNLQEEDNIFQAIDMHI